jgi:hypothetical protein
MYFQKKSSFYWLLILVGIVVFPTFSMAATLHAIVVGDTNDSSIGTSVQVDMKKLQSLMGNISRHTGLTLNPRYISGNQLSLANVNQAINGISAGSDDVIFFYWTGHGHNAGDSVLPTMNIKDWQETLGLSVVKATLEQKKPRLLIIIGDTCNKPTRTSREVETARTENPENYKELFLKYRGIIAVSSSKKGQFSYGNPQTGGLFTSVFLSSLSTELSSGSRPSWDALMKRTDKPINVGSGVVQEPNIALVGVEYGDGGGSGTGGGNNNEWTGGGGGNGTNITDCEKVRNAGGTCSAPDHPPEDDEGECVAGSYYKKDGGKTECCKTDGGGAKCWDFTI